MKNVLMKNYIMNDKQANEKALMGLGKAVLKYEYQYNRSTHLNRKHDSINHLFSVANPDSFDYEGVIFFDYEGVKFNMIICPAGEEVYINKNLGYKKIEKPFMLGETEVTQDLFEAVMMYNYPQKKANNPANAISWFVCADFCNRLSDYFGLNKCYASLSEDDNLSFDANIFETNGVISLNTNGFRLPKEWEWQIAAMAGTDNKYAGANDDESLKKVAWFKENSGNRPHPVAQKLPNEWGFYDMSGNVYEWCDNLESNEFENSVVIIEESDESVGRAIRGGCFHFKSAITEIQKTNYINPHEKISFYGFRIARSI
jgi:formylglycine-generating enzyme required for sulfatase activity